MNIKTALVTVALALPFTAWAGNCPNLINQIDEILAAKPNLDEETIVDEDGRRSVKQLRDEGEKAHKDGRHEESVRLLEMALKGLEELDE